MLLTKILSGVSIGLLIVCGLLYWQNTGLSSDLRETKSKLEAAQADVEQKTRSIAATDKVIRDLQEQNKDLARERLETNKKLADILSHPGSSAWGNSAAPEEVSDFLRGLMQDKGEKK